MKNPVKAATGMREFFERVAAQYPQGGYETLVTTARSKEAQAAASIGCKKTTNAKKGR